MRRSKIAALFQPWSCHRSRIETWTLIAVRAYGDLARPQRALSPTTDELLQAARWTRTHDTSDGFREMLERALRYLGVENAPLGP